jgi:hypothetical protein
MALVEATSPFVRGKGFFWGLVSKVLSKTQEAH